MTHSEAAGTEACRYASRQAGDDRLPLSATRQPNQIQLDLSAIAFISDFPTSETTMNCTDPEFWDERYRASRMPWDLNGVPPALIDYLSRAPDKGTVLVPGCGSGYEVQAFHDFGWKPLAIDFSGAAIERARAVLGDNAAAVRCADFFTYDFGDRFDLIYERTFLCSLPPERWPDYTRRMTELLEPGSRLAGLFAYGEESEPPPFPLTEAAAEALLGMDFTRVEDRAIPADRSLPLYAGKERWQVWQRK